MQRESVLTNDITDPYNPVEAYLYDRLFAPAVLEMALSSLAGLESELSPGGRCLDVGCGGGQIPLLLSQRRADVEVTGIDLSGPQVERGRRRAAKLGREVRFEVGSALDLPFEADSFDAVLSVTSIKHWTDRSRGLGECLRVLRPGGVLVVVEVDRSCYLDDVRKLLAHSKVPRPLRPLALPLLRTFIIGQGLDLDEGRELLAAQPLEERQVARIPGMPGLSLRGRLPAAAG